VFVFFGKISAKSVRKMLVKLTIGCRLQFVMKEEKITTPALLGTKQ